MGFQARKEIKTSWSPWRRHDTNAHRKNVSVEDLRKEGRGKTHGAPKRVGDLVLGKVGTDWG